MGPQNGGRNRQGGCYSELIVSSGLAVFGKTQKNE